MEMEDKPTEFEILTATAIESFATAGCDIVIMEVGLVGRLDSTNVIPAPEICVITNLSLEHTQFLGDTLAKIAYEKAGIIKAGCNVITYPVDMEAEEIYQAVAKERGALWHRADTESVYRKSATEGFEVAVASRASKSKKSADKSIRLQSAQTFSWHNYRDLQLALIGRQQIWNAVMVLEIVDKLREKGWKISETAVKKGLGIARWPARFEILRRTPLFICDGAHNQQCMEALRDNIEYMLPNKKITFLMGVLADKEYGEMLSFLLPHAKGFVCVTPDNPRALPAEKLAEYIRQDMKQEVSDHMLKTCETLKHKTRYSANTRTPAKKQHIKHAGKQIEPIIEIPVYVAESIMEGVQHALEIAKDDPVIACGSLYMMGDIRNAFFGIAEQKNLNQPKDRH